MFNNIEVISDDKKIFHNLTISTYLIEHGVPILGIDEEGYYFAKTKLYFDAIENAPLWIKFLLMFE